MIQHQCKRTKCRFGNDPDRRFQPRLALQRLSLALLLVGLIAVAGAALYVDPPVDADPPGLISFERHTPTDRRTNDNTLVFRATFNEDVHDVSVDDFAVTGTSATVTAVNAVSASVYDLTVSGGDLASYDGLVGINLAGGQNIADLADNALPAGEPGIDDEYELDNTPPADSMPYSTSHAIGAWDNDPDIDMALAFIDPYVNGYATELDRNPTPTLFDYVADESQWWTGGTFTAPYDGDWYVHIASVDDVGNWSDPTTVGPFRIDLTDPSVPTGLNPATAYTNDTSPILSWAPSTDRGSGIRTTGAYRIVVTGPVNRDTYVSDTDYNPTLSEGTFTWKVYARDSAGNASSYSPDATFIIDATPPNVAVEKAVGQDDPSNGSLVMFVAIFDEDIDGGTFEGTDVVVTGTAATGDPVIGWLGWSSYSISIPVTSDGTVVASLSAGSVEDFAGNPNTASTSVDNEVIVDTTSPEVTIDEDPSQDDPTNGAVLLFVAVFNEPIDDGTFTSDDVSVSGTIPPGAVVAVSELPPNDGTTFRVTVQPVGDGTAIVTIPAGGVRDLAGNTNNASSSGDNEVTVDTDVPEIVSVTPDAAHDADVGPLSVSITFDEPMDTNVNPSPTITGLATDLYTINGSAWSNGNQTWTGTFTLVDDEETATGIYQISGFADLAGNAMAPNSSNSIAVNTDNPTVLSLDASDGLITDADAGGSLFLIRVLFDQSMDPGATPSILFDPDVTAGASPTLVSPSSSWSWYLVDDGEFRISYVVAASDVDFDNVTVAVSGAVSKSGNLQVEYGPVWRFEVDTVNPMVDRVSVSDQLISQREAGGIFTVIVDFSEPMNASDGPTIAFVPALPSTLSMASARWTDAATFEAVYDIADNDVVEEGVKVQVSGGSDAQGNGHASFESNALFAVDTKSVPRGDLIVAPAGLGGAEAFLDQGLDLAEGEAPPVVGMLPLSAIYAIGETVTGACTLHCTDGTPILDSRIFFYLYRTTIEGMTESREPIETMVFRCDHDRGAYCFEVESADLEPGIYDIYLGFEDCTAEILRIELVEPPAE